VGGDTTPHAASAEVAEASDPATAQGELLAEWATSLDLEPAEVQGAFDRAAQIANEIGDSRDLDDAFAGLPDGLQRAVWITLADPSRRIEQIDALSDADFNQLEHLLDTMTDPEMDAVCAALGLTT